MTQDEELRQMVETMTQVHTAEVDGDKLRRVVETLMGFDYDGDMVVQAQLTANVAAAMIRQLSPAGKRIDAENPIGRASAEAAAQAVIEQWAEDEAEIAEILEWVELSKVAEMFIDATE